jgi:hypothetical protein
MNVKCPKCRLSFEVSASAGITELQCNCPRCGTPFTYRVDDEAVFNTVTSPPGDGSPTDTVGTDMSSSISAANPASDAAGSTAASASQVVPPPVPPQVSAQATIPFTRTIPLRPGGGAGAVPPPLPRRSSGCLKYLLLTVGVILALFSFIVYQCGGSSKSYTTEDVTVIDAADSGAEAAPIAVADPAYDANAHHGKAPRWIQGNWHVDTGYGGITVKIWGDNIAETSGGETSYGRFKYQNQRLYCDFGVGNMFIYRLDEDRKVIDAGNGLIMKKIEP